MIKASVIISTIYDKLGDPRTKNLFLVVLLAMTAFGMVAPETATTLRDTILKMAL